MFEVITLGSGSSGNATLIRGDASVFLVDAGLSARQLNARLQACGVSLEQLSGILLTHEHSDHTRALKTLLSVHDVPVYCNALTARALQDGGLGRDAPGRCKNWRLFQNGSAFELGEFGIRSFQVPHDAADPVGFRISAQGACFGVLTDLGHATRLISESLRGIRAVLIEANHDEELLHKDTRRPWSVKQRILSRHGHLSNASAARMLAELDAPLEHVILAHLSGDCNSPQLAMELIVRSLAATGRLPAARVHCAGRNEAGPALRII